MNNEGFHPAQARCRWLAAGMAWPALAWKLGAQYVLEGQKVIELLIEALPKLRRVGLLVYTTATTGGAVVTAARQAAGHFRLEAVIANMAKPDDIAPAFVQWAKARVQALMSLPSIWFNAHLRSIVEAALAQRWPTVGVQASIPSVGGLFSFDHNAPAGARRAAHDVDRILKGAKPGDLPIEQPSTFELVLNLKTARQLGITMPRSMLIRANEVIE